MSTALRQQIAAQLLGQIDWTTPTEGFCRCPGRELHTTPTLINGCTVFLDRSPTIHCFHHSCVGARKAMSYNLKEAIWNAETVTDR